MGHTHTKTVYLVCLKFNSTGHVDSYLGTLKRDVGTTYICKSIIQQKGQVHDLSPSEMFSNRWFLSLLSFVVGGGVIAAGLLGTAVRISWF